MKLESGEKTKTVRFGDLASFRNGLNFDRAASGQAVKVAGVGAFLHRARLDDFSAAETVRVRGQLSPDSLLRDGDLLFVRSNGSRDLVGRCAMVFPGEERVAFSGFTIRARLTRSDVDPNYLLEVARSELFRRELHEKGAGSSITNLSQDLLCEVEIPLPSLVEQRRIVAALALWDEAIDRTERLIDIKRLRRRESLRSALFGHRPEEDSDLPLVRKRVAGSNGWPIRAIGTFAREVTRQNRTADDLPVLSCTKHEGLVLSDEYFSGRRIYSEDTSSYKVVERGQFCYATNHIEEGSIGLQSIVDRGLVSPMYTVFEVDDSIVDRRFVLSTFKTETYRQVFEMSTSSSVNRRGGLRWSEFANLPFPLPSMEDQRRLATAMDALEHDLELEIARLDRVRAQRRGLVQRLLVSRRRDRNSA